MTAAIASLIQMARCYARLVCKLPMVVGMIMLAAAGATSGGPDVPALPRTTTALPPDADRSRMSGAGRGLAAQGSDCAPGSIATPDKFWTPGGQPEATIEHVPLPTKTGAGGKYTLNAGNLGINQFADPTLVKSLDTRGFAWANGLVNDTTGLPTSKTGGFNISHDSLADDFSEGLTSDNWMILLQKKGTTDAVDVVIDKVDHVHRPVVQLTASSKVVSGTAELASTGIIQTANLYGSGRFEITARFPPVQGLVSSLWLFHFETHFEQYKSQDTQYVDVQDGTCLVNHEIDIEIPASCSSMCSDGACQGDFTTANLNNYVFTNSGGTGPAYSNLCVKGPAAFADNRYHNYAIEWHTGTDSCPGRADFFFDGEYVGTNDVFAPTRGARFVVGIWGGYKEWVGPVQFQTVKAFIADVKITPWGEANDAYYPQRFDQPNDQPFAAYADISPPSIDEALETVEIPANTTHPARKVRRLRGADQDGMIPAVVWREDVH